MQLQYNVAKLKNKGKQIFLNKKKKQKGNKNKKK
jgi:hypothetical protein